MFYSHDFEVYYSDVDSQNKLKLCSLFNILQEIGCLHSSYAKLGLKDIPYTHLAWLVMAWKTNIFKFPSWNETLHAVTWSRNEDNLYAYRDYEIFDSNNNLIVSGSSKWVLFNTESNHIQKITDSIFNAFQPEEKRVFDKPFEKLKEPENSELTFSYTVLRRDIDTNGHMNNNNYLQIALEAIPESRLNLPINLVEVMYRHAAKLGDTISCLYSENENNERFITMKNEDLSDIYAIIKIK